MVEPNLFLRLKLDSEESKEVTRGHYFRKRAGRIHMAKDGYNFVRDRRNVTFLNIPFSIFSYINQLLNVCPRNTGSVEVSGSIPLGSTIYEACSHSRH